jgi:hypothetical protein
VVQETNTHCPAANDRDLNFVLHVRPFAPRQHRHLTEQSVRVPLNATVHSMR